MSTLTNHPSKPVQGDDEDYVDYLCRCLDHWQANVPDAPTGFALIECEAVPRHVMYEVADDDFYPSTCPVCTVVDLSGRVDRLRCKAEHRRWQTWRITHWFAGKAYGWGLIAGSGTSYNGCEKHPVRATLNWRGKRIYILGVRRDWWRCLLRYHHIRHEPMGLDLCGKCMPCPDCGSTTGCGLGCDNQQTRGVS